MKTKKYKLNSASVTVSIAVGACLSMLIGLLLIAVVSYVITNGAMAENAMDAVIAVIQFVCVLVGGAAALKISKTTAVYIPLIHNLVYVLMLIFANILFIDEGVSLKPGIIIAVIISMAVNCLIAINSSKGKKIKFRPR